MNQSIVSGDGAPMPDGGAEIPDFSHAVHFYDDDALLLDRLSESIGGALGGGRSCVVIATEAHRTGLAHRLGAVGLDLTLATAGNRYISMDADLTLQRFMRDGWPDETLFVQAIEPILRLARSSSRSELRPVVAFGEMVSILFREGAVEAALQVEKLWNELARRHTFTLHCAYPAHLFSGTARTEDFRRICAEHREIVPAGSLLHSESEGDGPWLETSPEGKGTPLQFALELRQREIAQRRKVEDRLRASEEFARAIIESNADWVSVVSPEGRVEYTNPRGVEALELEDRDDVLGRNWAEFWEEGDRARATAELASALMGRLGSFQAERSSAGGRRCWDVKITPARGDNGQITRLIVVARDISELRLAQTAAIRAEKLATAGRMAASIAHEINNPLEAVTNFIYLAQTAPGLPGQVRQQLELADRELSRVAHIARQTLGFYRSTSVSRWMVVSDLIRDALIVYERRMRNKELSIDVAVDPELKVYGKDGELRQALLNLTANSIDACQSGGRIWIRAQRSRNWTNGAEPGIRFTLADNGMGMTQEVQRGIFAPFFTTKADVGTGIGLWVTKCLVEQRGGYLSFRSRQGEASGTVMSFFLPEMRAGDGA